jgi:hypothetical protein
MKVHTKSTGPVTLRHTARDAATSIQASKSKRRRGLGPEPIKKLSKQRAKLSKQDLYDMLRQAAANT